ncbi:MAG TPA: lytic transglycosylase domain-containing protein [Thermoanaerobaculia bacterium]|jgi:soluble lytic murein transglycosylase-like protein|nr:lytic transglycosylase domain-containing protein [Thermoanaerobaculia bacterium]
MAEIRTTRPFQQRFLDGYDRSSLREEVQKVKPQRPGGKRKKYATWALGASLALGGIGTPMMFQNHKAAAPAEAGQQPLSGADMSKQIAPDLQAAQSIARQVAGGVAAVTNGVEQAAAGVTDVAKAPLSAATEAPRKLGAVTDSVKENFFKTQVPFGGIIYQEAVKNNLPPELVAAVVHTESKFKPTARSGAGAQGLMQLVPKTGRWMGARDLMNPAQNVAAGAKYLRYLSDRFDGDTQKAIAAYNAGEGNVRRFNGVPPFRETRNYVSRVRNFQRDLGDRLDNHAADATTQIADVGVQ